MLRVRDEMRMTVDAYRTLYESAVAFGMRKALQAEQGKGKLRKQVDTLLEEKEELQKKVSELNARMEANARKEVERKREEDQAHAVLEIPASLSLFPCVCVYVRKNVCML